MYVAKEILMPISELIVGLGGQYTLYVKLLLIVMVSISIHSIGDQMMAEA
jgi:hypothetical protein